MSAAFARLISVDVFRDGGSYEARFEADEGGLVALWLQRSAMPDATGLHHRELFIHEAGRPLANPLPLITGSSEEQDLLRRLAEFVAQRGYACEKRKLARLEQMIIYIQRREPLFPGMQTTRRPPPGWPD
jgi:hypothetical protein